MEKQKAPIILGMIMLPTNENFDAKSFFQDYAKHYPEEIEGATDQTTTIAFDLAGEIAVISHMNMPIPMGEVERTAQYAYNWRNAMDTVQHHKSHLLVTVMPKGNDTVKNYRLYTQVVCSLLRVTNAIGVYQGTQTLLIPPAQYFAEAEKLKEDDLPLNLWVYFCVVKNEQGFNSYTYGLEAFGKKEMEIIGSQKPLSEIRNFLYSIASYVVGYDVTFLHGQTCGFSAEERIPITLSQGVFLENDTFKLAY